MPVQTGPHRAAPTSLSRADLRPVRRRPVAYGRRLTLTALAGAVVGLVVLVWARGVAADPPADAGSILAAAGRLAALLASVLMVVQVVAMSRVTWIEQAWGHDRLARGHRTIGLWSFWLMMGHIGAIVVRRLGRDGPLGDALLDVFVVGAWMIWASLGTLCIVLVVVTSVRAARRRLRYERWHALHLYAYLGMAFALPHQVFVGQDTREPWVNAYWWAIYVVAAASVLVFRLGLPVWRSLYHGVRVDEVVPEADDVFSVHLRGHRLDRLRPQSGQFFVWRFRDGRRWTGGNPYTLSAAPTPDRLRVTVRVSGDGSARQALLAPGTRVWLEGPYGVLTARRRRHRRLVLVAAGVGITPFRAILEDAAYAPGEAVLVYRYAGSPVFRAELDELAARRGVVVHYLPGPRRADRSWLPDGVPAHVDDAAALRSLAPALAGSDVFVCGPPSWVACVRRAAVRAGVRRDQVHTEDFSW